METKFQIEPDSKLAKSIRKILTILVVLACIVAPYGMYTSAEAGALRRAEKQAQSVVQDIDVSITKKTNDYASSYSLRFEYTFVFKNNSDFDVSYIEGEVKIMDAEGNILSYGTATFGSTWNVSNGNYTFLAGHEKVFTLTWNTDMSDATIEIWETDFSALKMSFEITKIKVGNADVVNVTCDPYIKPSTVG